MKNYHTESAIITGGASGLGFATAKRLSKAGAKVTIFDLNAEAGAQAAKDIDAVFCQVDVTSEDQVIAGFEFRHISQERPRRFRVLFRLTKKFYLLIKIIL